jgi:NAD-dependent dihydropyrimidine dehydrogenase PreA subunit
VKQERDMVEIDEELCDGCGLCVPSCHEGAIKVINGKARLVAESLCDGLGACLGHCPRGALKVTHRVADPFVAPAVAEPVAAHHAQAAGGCPGSRMRILEPAPKALAVPSPGVPEASRLSHWPVQIRLVPPHAPFLDDARLVVAADCVPVAFPGFHRDFVDGHTVMIGCPKFDDLEAYTQKFAAIFATARVRSVTVVVMEVPCCRSLPQAVLRGVELAGAGTPVEVVVVGVDGGIRERTMARVPAAPGR